MMGRRLLGWLGVAVGALALGGCHGAVCGEGQTGLEWVFRLVDGVYRCEQVPRDPDRPIANFEFSPDDGTHLDEPVLFDGSLSTGRIAHYSWDLDGDGQFDDAAGATATHAFGEPGRHQVGLRVVDVDGRRSRFDRTVRIFGLDPPVADLRVSPNPARVGQTVTFDGSGSTGRRIDTYEWNFAKGDGLVRIGTTPTTTTTYDQPGIYPVSLTVTDEFGQRAVDEETLTVVSAAACQPPGPCATAAARAGRPGAGGAAFEARLDGVEFGRRGSVRRTRTRFALRGLSLAGELRGSIPRPGETASRLASFLRARWRARVDVVARRSSRTVVTRGLAIATFTRAVGSSCLKFRLTARGRRRRGTLISIAGTGEGATLAARATFRYKFTRRGSVLLRGRIRAAATDPRPVNSRCEAVRALRPGGPRETRRRD